MLHGRAREEKGRLAGVGGVVHSTLQLRGETYVHSAGKLHKGACTCLLVLPACPGPSQLAHLAGARHCVKVCMQPSMHAGAAGPPRCDGGAGAAGKRVRKRLATVITTNATKQLAHGIRRPHLLAGTLRAMVRRLLSASRHPVAPRHCLCAQVPGSSGGCPGGAAVQISSSGGGGGGSRRRRRLLAQQWARRQQRCGRRGGR